MTGTQRCDEIIRLIDQVLAECRIPAPGKPDVSGGQPRAAADPQGSRAPRFGDAAPEPALNLAGSELGHPDAYL